MDEQGNNTKQTVLLIGGSIILGFICLIGLAGPDGNKIDHEMRAELKAGTQLKDVAAYLKDHEWTYIWNKEQKCLTSDIPGAKWLPIVKPHYKKVFYFDNFNRLKSQNGNLEFGI
jgi:hypothetical protein